MLAAGKVVPRKAAKKKGAAKNTAGAKKTIAGNSATPKKGEARKTNGS